MRPPLVCRLPSVLAALWILVSLSPAGATPVGTVFSGPTSVDGYLAFWNPAALTQIKGNRIDILGGASLIRASYDRDTPSLFDGSSYPRATLNSPKPEISLGVSLTPGHSRWRIGLAAGFPIVDGAQWATEYDGRPSSTRYFVTQGRHAYAVIRPSIAYQVTSWLSLGVSLDIYAVLVAFDSMIDFGAKINQIACASAPANCKLDSPVAREDPSLQGLASSSGLGWDVGAAFSFLLQPRRWISIGGYFATGAGKIEIPVDVKIDLPSAVTDFVGSNFPSVALPELTAIGTTSTQVPLNFAVGVSIFPSPRLEIAADLYFVRRTQLQVLAARIEQSSSPLVTDQLFVRAYDEDWLVSARVAYQLLEKLRVGVRLGYDQNARPDRFVSPISVDFDKISLMLGATWQARPWLALTAVYAHWFLVPRTITSSDFGPNPKPDSAVEEGLDRPSPTGRYDGSADTFALGAAFQF
ncbi:MAG: outer membrane protein transport protein [Deltaproteobacteria bacterium]|nr:outer membrane protein transport protein [Deltaproteobacteria bacterium]